MSKRIAALLRGMASVLELSPEPRKLSVHIDKRTVIERLERDWKNVEADFVGACESVVKKKVDSQEKVDV